jgi:hypothetical protein
MWVKKGQVSNSGRMVGLSRFDQSARAVIGGRTFSELFPMTLTAPSFSASAS